MKVSDLNEIKFRQHFITELEAVRDNAKMSQDAMANWLGVSRSTYRRIVSGEVPVRGLYMMAALYCLTGKLAFEFAGVKDEKLELIRKLEKLPPNDYAIVGGLIDRLAK